MPKIQPISINSSSYSPSSSPSHHHLSIRETFTIWLKSLVFHGHGCTVFNSKGEVAYRVDNYQQKHCTKVLLMDSVGNVIFSINRKMLGIFGCWEGFNNHDSKEINPRFRVKRNHKILSKDTSFLVTLSCGSCYKIVGLEGKSAFKIVNFEGKILAEATQKHSSSGVVLGDDVLRLTMEPQVDQSLVMAIVIVYELIKNKI